MAHPGLRFVDFISFSGRARGLFGDSGAWVHPLYPVGYPLLLWMGHALTGDVLLVGRGLSIAGGVCIAAGVARWVSPWAGLWLLVQPALLQWGATEGTDTLAAAMCVLALASARRAPLWAGVLLGLGCLVRYTAITALPAVWMLSSGRLRTSWALALATVPHWGAALWLGVSPFPDQSSNVAIGGHATVWSMALLVEMPHRLRMALGAAIHDPVSQVGALGLLVGMLRRDRRAWALALAAFAHLLAVSLAFSNDRLVLPATLMMAVGASWLLPRWWLMLPASAAALSFALPRALHITPVESSLHKVVEVTQEMDGPFVTSSPWFYQQQDGWLVSGILLRRVAANSHGLTPDAVSQWMQARGVTHLALDVGRVRRTYPALGPLLGRSPPEGFQKEAQTGGWLVLSVVE